MNTEDSLSRKECIDSIPNAFLCFVHEDCLWAFAPERFMRWRPSPVHSREDDRWAPFPYVWDFGSSVVVPEHWLTWLSGIVARRSMEKDHRPLNPIGVKREATLVFEGTMHLGERRTLVVQPPHPFRGENLVVRMGSAPFVSLWGLWIGRSQQLRPRKGDDGREIPWPGTFFDGAIPVNMRFDTCLPAQNISLDVEIRTDDIERTGWRLPHDDPHAACDVHVELQGTEIISSADVEGR